MIRDFDVTDILMLNRARKRGLFLDSVPTLTWGRPMVPAAAVLSPFSGALGVFTAVMNGEEREPIIAQVSHSSESAYAHFTFLAPDSAIESRGLGPLIEYLIQKVGERGAQSLVAEVDEKSRTFEALRRGGFSIYSRQRILRVGRRPEANRAADAWRAVAAIDAFNVRKLYNLLVPGLVQQIEPAPGGNLHGWVLYEADELVGFAEVKRGPAGIWVQPFIHPQMDELDARLSALVRRLYPTSGRPAYFCLRSYSAWLAGPLEDLGGEAGPQQAVMARRLTSAVRAFEFDPLPELSAQPKTSSPTTLSQAEYSRLDDPKN
jgi:hypothetical protein